MTGDRLWRMDWLDAFFHAKWQVTADRGIYWREIVGNAFGLGSAQPQRLDPAMQTG